MALVYIILEGAFVEGNHIYYMMGQGLGGCSREGRTCYPLGQGLGGWQ